MSSLNWQAWSSLCSMIGSGGGRWDAPLKSTVRAQNTIKLNCAMNDSFFLFIYFITDFFFCLRRSRFDVGARENGLRARPNFLYAGKTLVHTHTYPPPLSLSHTHTHTHRPAHWKGEMWGHTRLSLSLSLALSLSLPVFPPHRSDAHTSALH